MMESSDSIERTGPDRPIVPADETAVLLSQWAQALRAGDVPRVEQLTASPGFRSLPLSEQGFLRGCCHWAAGRRQEAESLLLDCLRSAPEHAGATRCLASIYADQGKREEARQLLQGLLARDPSDLRSRLRLLLWMPVHGSPSQRAETLALAEALEKSGQRDACAMLVARLLLRESFLLIAKLPEGKTTGGKRPPRPDRVSYRETRRCILDLVKRAARLLENDGSPPARQHRWLCEVLALDPQDWPRKAADWLSQRPPGPEQDVPVEVRWVAAILQGMIPDVHVALQGAATLVDIARSHPYLETWKETAGLLWRVGRLAREPDDFVRVVELVRRFATVDPRVEKSMAPLLRALASRGLCKEYHGAAADRLRELSSLSQEEERVVRVVRAAGGEQEEVAPEAETQTPQANDPEIALRLAALRRLGSWSGPPTDASIAASSSEQAMPVGLEFIEVAQLIHRQDPSAPQALSEWLRRPGSQQVLDDAGIPLSGILAYLGTDGVRRSKEDVQRVLRAIDTEDLSRDQDAPEAFLRAGIAAGMEEEAVQILSRCESALACAKDQILKWECHQAARALLQNRYPEARRWFLRVLTKIE